MVFVDYILPFIKPVIFEFLLPFSHSSCINSEKILLCSLSKCVQNLYLGFKAESLRLLNSIILGQDVKNPKISKRKIKKYYLVF